MGAIPLSGHTKTLHSLNQPSKTEYSCPYGRELKMVTYAIRFPEERGETTTKTGALTPSKEERRRKRELVSQRRRRQRSYQTTSAVPPPWVPENRFPPSEQHYKLVKLVELPFTRGPVWTVKQRINAIKSQTPSFKRSRVLSSSRSVTKLKRLTQYFQIPGITVCVRTAQFLCPFLCLAYRAYYLRCRQVSRL